MDQWGEEAVEERMPLIGPPRNEDDRPITIHPHLPLPNSLPLPIRHTDSVGHEYRRHGCLPLPVAIRRLPAIFANASASDRFRSMMLSSPCNAAIVIIAPTAVTAIRKGKLTKAIRQKAISDANAQRSSGVHGRARRSRIPVCTQ